MWSGVGLFVEKVWEQFGSLDSSLSMTVGPSEARPVAKVVEAVCEWSERSERSEQAGTTSAPYAERTRCFIKTIKC